MSGKGSKRRPVKVDEKTFSENWDRIFKTKNEVELNEEYDRYEEYLTDNDHDYPEQK